MDSLKKLAELRAKKKYSTSNKTAEELVAKDFNPYEEVRLDDPFVEEKVKLKQKLKPFYERLKDKQS